jgi:hypothetical protein
MPALLAHTSSLGAFTFYVYHQEINIFVVALRVCRSPGFCRWTDHSLTFMPTPLEVAKTIIAIIIYIVFLTINTALLNIMITNKLVGPDLGNQQKLWSLIGNKQCHGTVVQALNPHGVDPTSTSNI